MDEENAVEFGIVPSKGSSMKSYLGWITASCLAGYCAYFSWKTGQMWWLWIITAVICLINGVIIACRDKTR